MSKNRKNKMKMNLPKDVLLISSLYKKAGKELYVVGGAVRDHLMGKEPKDYDLATNAHPEETIQILKKHFNLLDVGKSFGVIVAVSEDTPDGIEIAAFREDVGAGRRPEGVKYSTIEKDVLRRDLTINALFYNIDKEEIVDLVGGKLDIEERIIRTVGNPSDRFAEDPLRRLRAVRFMSVLGGKMDSELMDALRTNSDITGVSPERIRQEMLKILENGQDVGKTIHLLQHLKFIHQIFPDVWFKNDLFGKYPMSNLALMLRENIDKEEKYPLKRLQTSLNAMRWQIDEISTICFLIRLQDLTPENAYQLKKAQNRSKVRSHEITDFLTAIGKPTELISAFNEYQLSVNPLPLMDLGLRHEDLGREIEKIETKLFLETLNKHTDE